MKQEANKETMTDVRSEAQLIETLREIAKISVATHLLGRFKLDRIYQLAWKAINNNVRNQGGIGK